MKNNLVMENYIEYTVDYVKAFTDCLITYDDGSSYGIMFTQKAKEWFVANDVVWLHAVINSEKTITIGFQDEKDLCKFILRWG